MKKTKSYSRLLIVMLMTLVLSLAFLPGCAGKKNKPQTADPFFDHWKAKVEESRATSPEQVTNKGSLNVTTDAERDISETEIAPMFKLGSKDDQALLTDDLPTDNVTLKMRNANVGVVLRSLARAVNKSIIISENVKGKANINVIDSPWNEVFSSVLRTHGLTYNMVGEIIRIKTLEDMALDFKIESEYWIQDRARKMQKSEELVTRIFYLKYNVAKNIADLIAPMLAVTDVGMERKSEGNDSIKIPPKKSVSSDERNNAVIIHATVFDIERFEEIIKDLDRPGRQVLIEAQIVETTKKTARALGVQWGGLANVGNDQWVTSGLNSTGILGNGVVDSDGNAVGINPTTGQGVNFPATLADGTGMTLGFALQDLGKQVLSVQLSALETDGKLNILSSPSITTMNHQKAVVESGTNVPFQTVEDGEVKIEWKKAVLKLEVTPHVIDDNSLTVNVLTNKDELDWTRAALTQGNPTIITKKAETVMVLRDGQTTVIGGLSKNTISKSESGVPFLRSIPFLGTLFRSRSGSNDMEEVLIFITPHILKSAEERAAELKLQHKDEKALSEKITVPAPAPVANKG